MEQVCINECSNDKNIESKVTGLMSLYGVSFRAGESHVHSVSYMSVQHLGPVVEN